MANLIERAMFWRNDPAELESKNIQLINLLRANRRHRRTLREMVEAKAGLLQVLVHPYYFEDRQQDEYKDHEAARDRFIRACVKNEIPLVIFESWPYLYHLQNRLPADVKGIVFVIPTLLGPYPAHPHNMKSVIERFKNANVRRISVGGQSMWIWRRERKIYGEVDKKISPRWEIENFDISGCPGGLAKDLAAGGITTVLSSISYPDQMGDVLK